MSKPVTTSLVSAFGSNRSLAAEVGKLSVGCATAKIVFSGGLCETLYIKCRTLVCNDVHRHLINCARCVRDPVLRPKLIELASQRICHPDELRAAQLRCIDREAEFSKGGGIFGGKAHDPLMPIDLDWAVDYFVCGCMARHSTALTAKEFDAPLSVRYEGGGGDSATHYRSSIVGIEVFGTVLEKANFTTLDFRVFLDDCCNDVDDEFIYSDSPFPLGGETYKFNFNIQDHRDLATRLNRFGTARVVCRFYDNPWLRELYPESRWKWRLLDGGKKQTNEDAPEVLLINKSPP